MGSPARSEAQLRIPVIPGRELTSPSTAYWRFVDSSQSPIDTQRRREAVVLIHRTAGAVSTALIHGVKTLRTIELAGEDVDVARDPRARQALACRRPTRIASGERWELGDGTVYSDGLWWPLTVQGLGCGLVRLLARAPQSFHPGVQELVHFMSDWLAAAVLMDHPPPAYMNPTLLDPIPTGSPPP